MNHQYSPLRYPGGKAKIAPYLLSVLKNNNLSNCKYLEPFAGGAGAALELLLCEYVDSIFINDADRSIFSFWKSIITNSDAFIRKVEETEVTVSEWHKQKKILSDKNSSYFELGFATFFLNRCNVSGIISGGIIGGINQTGNWKIDARMNKSALVKKIEKISFYSDRIIPSNYDWKYFIENSLTKINSDRFLMYLDPPYYNKGQDLYMNYFVHEDHVKLEEYLRNKKNWILTYDFTPEIIDIYKEYQKKEFSLNYSARHARTGKEVMIFSKDIIV